MTINGNNWYVSDNKISFSYYDWVAFIDPVFVGNGNLLRWSVVFSKGTPDPGTQPIYCYTLEGAMSLVENYKEQKLYDQLMDKLKEDYNIDDPSVVIHAADVACEEKGDNKNA